MGVSLNLGYVFGVPITRMGRRLGFPILGSYHVVL